MGAAGSLELRHARAGILWLNRTQSGVDVRSRAVFSSSNRGDGISRQGPCDFSIPQICQENAERMAWIPFPVFEWKVTGGSFPTKFPEQHDGIISSGEPVRVEARRTDRFIRLYPAGIPEKDNGIVPVSETGHSKVLWDPAPLFRHING
jgi:hypothetical protein